MTKMNERTKLKWVRDHKLFTTRHHEQDSIMEALIRELGDTALAQQLANLKLWSPQCSVVAAVFWLRGCLGSEALHDYFRNKGAPGLSVPRTQAGDRASTRLFLRLHEAMEMAICAEEILSRFEKELK